MTSMGSPTVQIKVHIQAASRGRKKLITGPAAPPGPTGNLPRITRLMALAIRFDHLIHAGEVKDLADIARLGHVTRARVTQIMNLLHLAPDIQESLLFLGLVHKGGDPVSERDLRAITKLADWREQRKLWIQLTRA
ncbi:MAG: hypothetical protein AMXMBFR58_29240 [Phycisphaerae bacterium]